MALADYQSCSLQSRIKTGGKEMKFKMIHHVDQRTIDEMYHTYSPVFILSTGRAGSKFITKLLNLSFDVSAFHEPRPTLEYFSNYAFHHQHNQEILADMINAARMESILDVFIEDKIYVESNQCLTFFAPAIASLLKKAKFVHVVRHPGDFVRSAVRKGWHKNDSIWESGRIKMAEQDLWNRLDHIEKLCWLWNTTNRFVKVFFTKIEKERTALFKIEDLLQDVDSVNSLFRFIGVKAIAEEQILEIQRARVNEMEIHPDEPPNMKKVRDFPFYSEWNDEMKSRLKIYSGELGLIYDYDL